MAAQHIAVRSEDPYKHIAHLGDGAYGIVDKVEREGKVYARKRIRVTNRNQDQILRDAKQEFNVLRRLRHRHVIEVVEIFQCKKSLLIIMAQVADTDLKEYMELGDSATVMATNAEFWATMRQNLEEWPVCLIQAIDHLHEMRVKHRDLKPANLLIMGNRILIADFGVSKDLIDEDTTASLTDAAKAGSPMYWAPEIVNNFGSHKRGRAVDIFALGCIFLEISTLLSPFSGGLSRFSNFREGNNSRAFGRCPGKLLQWMRYLWGLNNGGRWFPHPELSVDTWQWRLIKLSFLMLDPNPKMRITARQLVSLLESDIGHYGLRVDGSCSPCTQNCLSKTRSNSSNLPLHSIFKPLDELKATLNLPGFYLEELKPKTMPDWQDVKREWLSEHMWW